MKRLRLLLAELTVLAFAFLQIASAALTNRCVFKDNPSPQTPYTNWADAATNIQDAINVSYAGETVWVSNGVYDTGGVTNWPSGTILTNRIAITNAITVRSMNGPALTTIKGRWDPDTTNGPAAIRCVYMTNNSSLIGFMLTNGATLQLNYPTSGSNNNHYSGGVYCQTAATISNCVIAGNAAAFDAGGSYKGTLHNCTIVGNSAGRQGGGSYGSTLYSCMLSGNSAGNWGGGMGVGNLYNCTIVGNSAGTWGGGAYYGSMYNCIIYFNTAGVGVNSYASAIVRSCINPLTGGSGSATESFTNNPMFIANGSGYGASFVAGNYRLSANSPCINAGTNGSWTTNYPYDLDGRARIRYGTVDMGAYERINDGTIYTVH